MIPLETLLRVPRSSFLNKVDSAPDNFQERHVMTYDLDSNH